MSKEAVLRFRKAVNEDEELQDEIRVAAAAGKKLNLVGIGAQHGFEFTADELAAVGGDVESELTEFELEMVAGGADERGAPRAMMSAARSVPPQPEPEPESDC